MIQKTDQVKNNMETGKLGEKLALRFLTQKGYSLVCANYHIRGGELDLVMRKNGILVFVEVKTRKTGNFGFGDEAVNYRKKQSLPRKRLFQAFRCRVVLGLA